MYRRIYYQILMLYYILCTRIYLKAAPITVRIVTKLIVDLYIQKIEYSSEIVKYTVYKDCESCSFGMASDEVNLCGRKSQLH